MSDADLFQCQFQTNEKKSEDEMIQYEIEWKNRNKVKLKINLIRQFFRCTLPWLPVIAQTRNTLCVLSSGFYQYVIIVWIAILRSRIDKVIFPKTKIFWHCCIENILNLSQSLLQGKFSYNEKW